MAKAKQSPYVTQAQDQALVRFGPERSALVALLQQAAQDRDTAVSSARSTSDLVRNAVDQARPGVAQAYNAAIKTAAAQQAIAAPQLTPGSPFAQAAAIEASGLNSRLAETQANETAGLSQRRIQAAEGAAYAQTAANRQYAQSRQQITQRAADLGDEEGAFTASTATDLATADAKSQAQSDEASARIRQQERDSQRSAGIDPDTLQPIPGGKLDPSTKASKKKWATSTAQAAASDQIQQARNEIAGIKDGFSRGEAASLILTGAPASSKKVYEPIKQGNRTIQRPVLWKAGDKQNGRPIDPSLIGTQKTIDIPATPQIKSQLLLSAALDMEYDGHLSRRNQQLLHARGIKLAPLGLLTYQQWLKQNRQPVQRPGTAPGANGQQRPT